MIVTRFPQARSALSFVCRSCRSTSIRTQPRAFSTTTRQLDRKSAFDGIFEEQQKIEQNTRRLQETDRLRKENPQQYQEERRRAIPEIGTGGIVSLTGERPAHHLHVYSHKHNTHITLTKPNRDPIISVSTGNLGFRKAGRGSFDAAYQLCAYVLNKIAEDPQLLREMRDIDLVLRGFGNGREAVTKALMGNEGRHINRKISRVMDSTRIKFGGTRSPAPRRLG